MTNMPFVLLALHRIGPYHHGRILAALESGIKLTVLETRPLSREYPWLFETGHGYQVLQLRGGTDAEHDPPVAKLDQQLVDHLCSLHPQVVVSVGWADRAYQRLLLACNLRRIPAVIVSDSREHDQARTAHFEWLKRNLLCGYSAALVAGNESRSYLERLRFPHDAIFQPWDVVDNAFFSRARAASHCSESPVERHFLCVSRFVAKKNHVGLLRAYAAYQSEGGSWGLRLIGTGPMEDQIRMVCAKLPYPRRVRIDPFLQLEPLQDAYGQAACFVLASHSDQWGLVVNEAMAAGLPVLVSKACGCAVDLVDHGVTGWTFDPADPAELTALMHGAERQSLDRRVAMTKAARARLDAYSPARFADGFRQAVEWASAHPRHSRRAALVAHLLSLRTSS